MHGCGLLCPCLKIIPFGIFYQELRIILSERLKTAYQRGFIDQTRTSSFGYFRYLSLKTFMWWNSWPMVAFRNSSTVITYFQALPVSCNCSADKDLIKLWVARL